MFFFKFDCSGPTAYHGALKTEHGNDSNALQISIIFLPVTECWKGFIIFNYV